MYLLTCKRFLNECDGVLIQSSHSWERASLIQMEEWLKSLQNPLPLYVIGPLLTPGYGHSSAVNSASEQSQGEKDVQVFLNEMQANYGEGSVVFVNFFFTIRWMPQIFIVIISDLFRDDLLAYGTGVHRWSHTSAYRQKGSLRKFLSSIFIWRQLHLFPLPLNQILAHASPFAQLSEEFVSNVKSSGLGILAKWAPQQYILSHPVCELGSPSKLWESTLISLFYLG